MSERSITIQDARKINELAQRYVFASEIFVRKYCGTKRSLGSGPVELPNGRVDWKPIDSVWTECTIPETQEEGIKVYLLFRSRDAKLNCGDRGSYEDPF